MAALAFPASPTVGQTYTANGKTWSWNGTAWQSANGGGAVTVTNDTSTASFEYPLFAAATSGTVASVYTSNANLLYKPSTGELQSQTLIAGNGIFVNSQTIASNYTIATGQNGVSAGVVMVNSGITVTISSGSTWAVV